MSITLPIRKHGSDITKLFLSCGGVILLIYIFRHSIPSYNAEKLYFPILKAGSEAENNERRLKIADDILLNFDWNILKVGFTNLFR